MKKSAHMNIGMYIAPTHTVPPNEKNILAPWILTEQLVDGLIADDHAVTLFAAKGSNTQATLVHGDIEPTIVRMREFADHSMYVSLVTEQNLSLLRKAVSYIKSHDIDVLHVHTSPELLYPALLAIPAKTPVIVTFHDPIVPERFPALEKVYGIGNVHFVSLSKSQQYGVPFSFAGVVPNGVDTKLFCPDTELPLHDRPVIMTGRIVKQKGFHDAIEAVKISGDRLLIIGQSYDHNDAAKTYYEDEIVPHVDNAQIMMEPVVKSEHLVGHYQTAKALLFPIHWEEPFGLVMIEAMACGTPVIAYNRGSVPEIIKDGITGFIIDPPEADEVGRSHVEKRGKWTIKKSGVEGLVEALSRIGEIDRTMCRRHVESQFTLTHMVKGYEQIYAKLSAGQMANSAV